MSSSHAEILVAPSLVATPTRQQLYQQQQQQQLESSVEIRGTPTRISLQNASTVITIMTKAILPFASSSPNLDESLETTATDATTYVSDETSSPILHHSPFSLLDTSCDLSAEFSHQSMSCGLPKDSEWNIRTHHDSPKAALTRSVSTTCTVPATASPLQQDESHNRELSLQSDALVEIRCPSPTSTSSRRASRAKRRHRQLQPSLVTPTGIFERRRPSQISLMTDHPGGSIGIATPTSSSDGRSSPDTDSILMKPVVPLRRPRRMLTRPQVFLTDSDTRQPLTTVQHSIRRLHSNGVIGILCLAGLCFLGMIFLTNCVFFSLDDSRLPGLIVGHELATRRRRITTFHPDSSLVNGGLRGVVSYATASKPTTVPRVGIAPRNINTKNDEQRRVLDKQKSKTQARRKSLPPRRSWQMRLETKPPAMLLAEVEAERRVARGIGLVIHPPPKLWMTTNATFDRLDQQMYRTSKVERFAFAPRVVALHDTPVIDVIQRQLDEFPAEFTDNTQYYSIFDSSDERLQQMELREPFVQGECVPMQDWQTTFHPSCNGMHELGMEHMGERNAYDVELFGIKGYWRSAWKFESLFSLNETGRRDTFVVKTLRFQHNFEDAHFEHSRVDAVAMERLTASPHVINIFGFCGHSVMTEYADGKRVGKLADKMKKTPLARLRIARDIANGLADVHGIDGDGNATFVHFDVNLANVVSIDNTLKLNDFNIGIIRRWNTTSNTPCGFPAQYPNPQWRSPEEARNEQNLTEKVDVFSMGHIFFRLICGHEPWNKLEKGGKPSQEVITTKVQRGVLPFILQEVMNTTDKEVAAIRDAMLQCYIFDPLQRPSARDIAKQLDRALAELSSSRGKSSSSRIIAM